MSNDVAMADSPWPVLVTIQENEKSTALMNRKAYRKSRESGTAWIYHPQTGRVLPWPGQPSVLSLVEGAGCFELTLPAGSEPHPYGEARPPKTNPDDRSVMQGNAGEKPSDLRTTTDILSSLCHTIAARHTDMPEGSYTTHLFENGVEKIRKKTGEEAVELILARTTQDIVFESADLVYHMLVLLEAEGIAWSDVLAELERRHS